jgi:hypothetical protein
MSNVFISMLLQLDKDNLLSHYHTWGPSARICIELERQSIDPFTRRTTVETGAAYFVANSVQVSRLALGLDFTDDVPHTIFAVTPKTLDESGRGVAMVHIATTYLSRIVARAFAAASADHQASFFFSMTSYPWLRSSAGWLFQKLALARLTSPTSEQLNAEMRNGRTFVIPICEKVIPLSGISGLGKADNYSLPFLWCPTSQTVTTVDYIICTSTHLILVQCTLSSEHDVSEGYLETIYSSLPIKFRNGRQWYFLFLTDSPTAAEKLRNAKFPCSKLGNKPIKVCSAVFRVERAGMTAAQRERLMNIMVRMLP